MQIIDKPGLMYEGESHLLNLICFLQFFISRKNINQIKCKWLQSLGESMSLRVIVLVHRVDLCTNLIRHLVTKTESIFCTSPLERLSQTQGLKIDLGGADVKPPREIFMTLDF